PLRVRAHRPRRRQLKWLISYPYLLINFLYFRELKGTLKRTDKNFTEYSQSLEP
ncbi:MAG: hypothetical protein RLZ57_326, partial [Actinomycetota bacterium]